MYIVYYIVHCTCIILYASMHVYVLWMYTYKFSHAVVLNSWNFTIISIGKSVIYTVNVACS